MKKNFMLKGLSALIILGSVGLIDSPVNLTQHVANAERNVIEIKDGNGQPYSGVVAFQGRNGGATGFVVGKNTVVTNKHVTQHLQVGSRVNAHPSSFGNSGGVYTVRDIVPYPGDADLAVVHVNSIGDEGRNFNEFTTTLPISTGAQVGERVTLIGYPQPLKNKYNLYASLGTVDQISNGKIVYDAFAESGNSGSPILNENGEAIGVHYASNTAITPQKKSFGVLFTDDIKNFILSQIEQ
ncbi:trypsin-like serine peptidase [Staphylococcus felis]|uniref:Serine protease n=1 Tax=Staphylococcus felis TaxID=46127 RepID=A0A3E0IMS4_9STAP|nr:serine protease [Staphylococcus felis]REH92743.1 serine protease [Staphylococcus felis]